MIHRLLVATYLFACGLLLAVAPWTRLWDRNFFAAIWPWLGVWMANQYVRGAVTGIGVITAVAGLRDFARVVFDRQRPFSPSSSRETELL